MHRPPTLNRIVIDEAFAAGDVFCHYCGRQVFLDRVQKAPDRATGDHKVPRCRGGQDVRSNIVICCYACNHQKELLTDDEFLCTMHDPYEMGRLKREWLVKLGLRPENPGVERRIRRAEMLASRLQDPDPNCPRCRGTGRQRGNLKTYCFCAVKGVDPGRVYTKERSDRRTSVAPQ